MSDRVGGKDITVVANILWFAIIVFLTWQFPYLADDFGHMNSILTGDRLTSISQLIPSDVYYYQSWGGRFVSMILIQSLLMMPKPIFDVLNAVVYVLTINLIVSIGESVAGKKIDSKKRNVVLSAVFLIYWFCCAQFAQVSLWLTGSITYLWMTCIILGFVTVMLRKTKPRAFEYPLFLVGGILAGFTLEVGACTLLVAYFIIILIKWRKHSLDLKWVLGGIGMLIGVALLMLAPGNFVRSSIVKEQFESGGIMRYVWRLARETYYALRYLLLPAAISCALFIFKRYRKNGDEKSLVREPEIFIYFLVFVSVYVMTFSSGHSIRVLQFPLILLLTAIAISLIDIIVAMNKAVLNRIWIPFAFLIVLVFVEIVTGIIQVKQYGAHFDRYTTYHYMDESSSLLEGNGMNVD